MCLPNHVFATDDHTGPTHTSSSPDDQTRCAQGPAQYYAHSGQHHIITLVLHSYHAVVVVYREEAENYDRGSGSMGRTYCSGDI